MIRIASDHIETLLYEEESPTLDFKREQYVFDGANNDDKSELLKDILAFANAWRRSEAFILIGVEEIKGGRSKVVGITNHLDDAKLQQFVNKKTQRPVSFSYTALEFEGKQIGVIAIALQERPIYLARDYGKLKANTVYIRRGTSTDIASPDEISKMGDATVRKEAVREPLVRVSFIDSEDTVTTHLRVPAMAELNQEECLQILKRVMISDEDTGIVQSHKKELESIKDYHRDGSMYHPFSVEGVLRYHKKIIETIHLIENNFEEFRRRYNAHNRSINLSDKECVYFKTSYAIFEIFNDGTTPAENIIIYINSTEKIRLFTFKEILDYKLRLHSEIPNDIKETIELAKMLPSDRARVKKTYEMNFLQMRSNGWNRERWHRVSPLIGVNEPKPVNVSLNNGNLKINIRKNLMHNHSKHVSEPSIYICPFLEQGELAEIEYICHANNLAKPSRGQLTLEGISETYG